MKYLAILNVCFELEGFMSFTTHLLVALLPDF